MYRGEGLKTSLKIIFKVIVFTYLLSLTPFFTILPDFLHFNNGLLTSSIYKHEFVQEEISIKDQLNLMKIDEGVALSGDVSTIEILNDKYIDNTPHNKQEKKPENNQEGTLAVNKKVYIYNTHQNEEYSDGKSVIDASVELANRLQKAGIQVVYETNSFPEYLKNNGLDYNSSYEASYYYLNEAMVNYGGFDLVIDFHRDSVPRENSFVTIGDKNYAKMMFVVGGLSSNVNQVTTLSQTLSNYIETLQPGVIKPLMVREAYYNQQVYENSVLIEMGSDANTYEEVYHSTNLLADAIIQYLR